MCRRRSILNLRRLDRADHEITKGEESTKEKRAAISVPFRGFVDFRVFVMFLAADDPS
jgi:hypothetical protein